MPPTPLLIVGGPPASGKTTLARRLAADLRLPLLSRDDCKERLFDTLGTGWPTATAAPNHDATDRAWSRRLGGASYELLWGALETQLAAGVATIVESNFRGARAAPLPLPARPRRQPDRDQQRGMNTKRTRSPR